MKEYRVCCDGGSFCIGNETMRVMIQNGYGDCSQSIFVVEDGETLEGLLSKRKAEKLEWKGQIEGRIRIYSYDCIHNEKDEEEYRVAEIEGLYNIYRCNMWGEYPELYLVKWGK